MTIYSLSLNAPATVRVPYSLNTPCSGALRDSGNFFQNARRSVPNKGKILQSFVKLYNMPQGRFYAEITVLVDFWGSQ